VSGGVAYVVVHDGRLLADAHDTWVDALTDALHFRSSLAAWAYWREHGDARTVRVEARLVI